MRRSLRDAIVGFSLIGGVIVFSGTMLWLRGFRLGSTSWEITASFKDASGLAEMSPVTYRGILVGSVKKISFTPDSVNAKIQINFKDLILPKPVLAKIVTSSVLGGDAELSLISIGKSDKLNKFSPIDSNCQSKKILCDGEKIKGEKLISISSITEGIEEIVSQAERQKVINKVTESINQFDETQTNLDELISLSKTELERAGPIITEITQAAIHINNILASIDNEETLNDIKSTVATTSTLTNRIESFSDDMEKILGDKELIEALRNVTIGLGKLFNEIYP